MTSTSESVKSICRLIRTLITGENYYYIKIDVFTEKNILVHETLSTLKIIWP